MFVKTAKDDVNKLLKRVGEFEEKGKLHEAVEELRKAIEMNSKDGNLYNRLGDLYIRNNQTQEAIEAYRRGVNAYRHDLFPRNALALCKKILRYEPNSSDMYRIMGELLAELDEKGEAVKYLFEYIEKQKAEQNTDEIIKTLEYIDDLRADDQQVVDKVHELYEAIGKNNREERTTVIPEEKPVEDVQSPPVVRKKTEVHPEKPHVREDHGMLKDHLSALGKHEKKLQGTVVQIDEALRGVESTIGEIRKATRIDEVVTALETSLTTLSTEQKKAIALLQKSLSNNLENLQQAIGSIQANSDKNIKDLMLLLHNLNKALASLSQNQASFAQGIKENLENVGKSIACSTHDASQEIKDGLSEYRKATDSMCSMFSETKECSVSLLGITDEMKTSVQKMNELLSAFVMTQTIREKRQRRYTIIIIAIMSVIGGLLLFSMVR